MRDIARMRTIKQCTEYFKQNDPESKVGEYMLRQLIKQKKIPVVHAGKKQLINLDRLIEYLNGEIEEVTVLVDNGYGTIRKINE